MKILFGKIKSQIKVCQRGIDMALEYRTMLDLFIVSDEQHRKYKEKLLMQEAKNQEHDRRLHELIKQYQNNQLQ